MKLALLGGGGFRTPLVHGALLADDAPVRVDELRLFDVDADRLAVIARVLEHQAVQVRGNRSTTDRAPRVITTTDPDEALADVDMVFSAVRVGGARARVADERVALDLGVLGQETTGPGGLSFALRTIPVALDIARRTAELAPQAWVVNFTNPAGLITEAMQSVLGDRVIGICDSPIAMARRVAGAVGAQRSGLRLDYCGLNHLGWLQHLWVDKPGAGPRDLLPELFADDLALGSIEEAGLFGTEWLRTLGMLPNEYLHYYYFARESAAAIRSATATRGEYLRDQQAAFYRAAGSASEPLQLWERTRRDRNATYMSEQRDEADQRSEDDIAGGGYEGVALRLMAALRGAATPSQLVLNVRNGTTMPALPADAVIEVPCTVTPEGPAAVRVSPLPGHAGGLVQQVKSVEQLTILAAATGDARTAEAAFALHPLVDSVDVARRLLTGYRRRIPAVDAVFRSPGAC